MDLFVVFDSDPLLKVQFFNDKPLSNLYLDFIGSLFETIHNKLPQAFRNVYLFPAQITNTKISIILPCFDKQTSESLSKVSLMTKPVICFKL